MGDFLTPEEVAERCRVTRRTVYDWLGDGKLPGVRIARKWLVPVEGLERLLSVAPQEPVAGGEVAAVEPASSVSDKRVPPARSKKRGRR